MKEVPSQGSLATTDAFLTLQLWPGGLESCLLILKQALGFSESIIGCVQNVQEYVGCDTVSCPFLFQNHTGKTVPFSTP